MSEPSPNAPNAQSTLAIVCGAGSLPFALADAAVRRGRRVVLFALRGWADPQRVAAYPHHWTWMGQFDRFRRLAAVEGCRDVASGLRHHLVQGASGKAALWQVAIDGRQAEGQGACLDNAPLLCQQAP